jgi:hypothetical protein
MTPFKPRDYISVGLLVSRGSSLFALWKALNIKPGFKAFKIWEDRPENLANIPKNDVIVLDDDARETETVEAFNAFVNKGGFLIQLFSPGKQKEQDYIIKNGALVSSADAILFEGMDAKAFESTYKDFAMMIVKEFNGAVISFSKNIFIAESELEDDATSDDENERGGKYDDGVAQNLDFFINVIKYLLAMKHDAAKTKEDEIKRQASTVAIMIHGPSLWLGGKERPLEAMIAEVFHHLGVDDLFPQVARDPEYRSIDADQRSKFPEIFYYHRTFTGDEDTKSVKNSIKYMDQAKKIHATIRAEKNWELDSIPVFFQDLAGHCLAQSPIRRVYLLPPATIGDRTPDASFKLLVKCFLEPLAVKGVESFQLAWTMDGVHVIPSIPDIANVKPRVAEAEKSLVLLHGTELASLMKDQQVNDFLTTLEHVASLDLSGDGTSKILVHVAVDEADLQDRIKEMTFNSRKVEEKRRARIKKDTERLQEKLHASQRIDRDRKMFEDRGFSIIEVEDSQDIDHDIQVFFIEQVCPFVLGNKISTIHELLPVELESYFMAVIAPLVARDRVTRITM